MNINLRGAYKNQNRELITIKNKIANTNEVSEILEDMENIIGDAQWLNEQLLDFLIEIRDRKKEGEKGD
ncbi:MAG: hypothetical protein GXP61_08200 [Epsilonproteobacteria bacterium]|nr:hypothetical protein [Campylobacterota bacterium]